MGLNHTPFRIGRGKSGTRNLITDVPGVTVGQVTIKDPPTACTGVTAILPHRGDLFHDKVMAAACVFNGYGKTTGLVQVEELGTIESPILLTNTLSVGTAATACIKYMMEKHPDIGREAGTVNPLVGECNDGSLNDIRALHVTEAHVAEALASCGEDFSEGAVGAGTGMCCLGFKGGIGSASRLVTLDGHTYTVGALVLSNFGERGRLTIDGRPLGREILEKLQEKQTVNQQDKGSIIMILATDIPLTERQLKRVARRAGVGLSRTGSFMGNGSGDIAIAFSTANRVPHDSPSALLHFSAISDGYIDPVFDMAAEAVEEAIISSLWHAETTEGRDGRVAVGLKDAMTEVGLL